MSPDVLNPAKLPTSVSRFYESVLRTLREQQIPFLVGGAFALRSYTGVSRDTKDLDIFLMAKDIERALQALNESGWQTELKYPHWLAKVHGAEHVVDLIFNSGNGLCPVDEDWFLHSKESNLLGETVKLMPREEMIWQKAFIMERHRFDGADVINLIQHHGDTLDWDRILRRFGEHFPLLLAHLVLHRFIYPHPASAVTTAVLHRLMVRMEEQLTAPADNAQESRPICRGTFLSLLEYLPAVLNWGYRDARLPPTGNMSAAEIVHWTTTVER